jgi:hypothetical protein
VSLTGGGTAVDGVQNMAQVAASQAQYVRILFQRQVRGERYGGRVAKWAENLLWPERRKGHNIGVVYSRCRKEGRCV